MRWKFDLLAFPILAFFFLQNEEWQWSVRNVEAATPPEPATHVRLTSARIDGRASASSRVATSGGAILISAPPAPPAAATRWWWHSIRRAADGRWCRWISTKPNGEAHPQRAVPQHASLRRGAAKKIPLPWWR
jgi:hypothetical protein